MTTTNKRRHAKQTRAGATATATQPAPKLPFELQPMPDWRWRTLPVFFMFSARGDDRPADRSHRRKQPQNNGLFLGATTAVALMLGLGFSRLATRFLLSRSGSSHARSGKPRPELARIEAANSYLVSP